MMEFIFNSSAIPIVVAFAFMAIAAIVEWKTWRVPNALIAPALLAAFIFAGVAGSIAADRTGGLGSAFVGMIVGAVTLLPVYAKVGLGAGCVKAQAAFGAWLGAGLTIGNAALWVFVASLIGAALAIAALSLKSKNQGMKSHAQSTVDDQVAGKQSAMHAQVFFAVGSLAAVAILSVLV